MCHTAAKTSPRMTTRRGKMGVAKNSRIAKRYTMPATVKEAMKYGPPLSPKFREQSVSATHNVAKSMYTHHSGVIFTIQPCPSVIVSPYAQTQYGIETTVSPLRERVLIPCA